MRNGPEMERRLPSDHHEHVHDRNEYLFGDGEHAGSVRKGDSVAGRYGSVVPFIIPGFVCPTTPDLSPLALKRPAAGSDARTRGSAPKSCSWRPFYPLALGGPPGGPSVENTWSNFPRQTEQKSAHSSSSVAAHR